MATKAWIVLDKIQKQLDKGYKISSGEMKVLAEDMANKIKVRTRLGKDSNRRPLKALKAITIENRKWAKKKGKLYNETTPTKSNLTFTGQLLNSLYGDSKRDNQLNIELKEKRKNESVTNSEVTMYQELQDRIFLGFSDAEKKYLYRKIMDIFLKRG